MGNHKKVVINAMINIKYNPPERTYSILGNNIRRFGRRHVSEKL